ncbi:MAG: hypothetical protein H8E91_06685 [Planctomycetes bacterium]|nr:hypothetical protein [Planctomycetota bacterium]
MIQRILICIGTLLLLSASLNAEGRDDVIASLNSSDLVKGTEEAQAWRIYFDGCLDLTAPPQPLSNTFNMNTVWPEMNGWQGVSMWASENEHMEAAILTSAGRIIIGLPYGSESVPASYRDAGIFIEIGEDDRLHDIDFSYIETVQLASLWATAESYRLLQNGEPARASKLAMAQLIVLRKFCDRIFLDEKIAFMEMLGDGLSNFRDMMYTYRDAISPEKFREIAREWIPYLRTDASRLLLPVGDQIVAQALLEELFTTQGDADSAKFREILTDIQVKEEPFTRFGAARFWESMAYIHSGHDASVDRLEKIYDDWWRRWRLRAFHQQLGIDSELEKTNPVRYAAVRLIVRDIQKLFYQRDLLWTQINGTAVSAALCGYKNHYGTYPKSLKMLYAQFLHRTSNLDRFKDLEKRTDSDWSLFNAPVGHFHYRRIDEKTALDTENSDRLWIDAGSCILYSVAADNEDNRGSSETKDLILWPPVKVLERTEGIVK